MSNAIGELLTALQKGKENADAVRLVFSYANSLYDGDIEPMSVRVMLVAIQSDGANPDTALAVISSLCMVGVLAWDFDSDDDHPKVMAGPLFSLGMQHLLNSDGIVIPHAVSLSKDIDRDVVRQLVSNANPEAESVEIYKDEPDEVPFGPLPYDASEMN